MAHFLPQELVRQVIKLEWPMVQMKSRVVHFIMASHACLLSNCLCPEQRDATTPRSRAIAILWAVRVITIVGESEPRCSIRVKQNIKK